MHAHDPGRNGGIIVSVGQDHYHAEALFEPGGVFKLFMLDKDQAKVMTVGLQELTAYVRTAGRTESVTVKLEPQPQPGDPDKQTSLFVGKMPPELVGRQLIVIVPSIEIAGQRYRFSFTTEADEHGPPMPTKVVDEAERQLYLEPGGLYTALDIQANGNIVASEKYQSFESAHDPNPQPGDRVCPITGTKANASCTWVVGGKEYQFCCPPCIDEFVRRAKKSPDEIKAPDAYVKAK